MALRADTPRLAFDPARALPAAAYREPAWLKAEKAGIWHGAWVFATTEDGLENPGDQFPVAIVDQPVLLLRNRAGDACTVQTVTVSS